MKLDRYSNSSGGTPIATGNSFTTPFLTNTTTYYVDALPFGCTTGIRTAIVATIKTIPILTVNQPVSICENNSTTINASTTAGVINWFSSLTSTIPIATGTSFTTPLLTQNITYYIEGNNNGCLSVNRIPISIEINPKPVVTDENLILCQNKNLILDAGISNVSYLWSTTETTKTIQITIPGIYKVIVTNSPQGCSSLKTITVTQNNIPIIDKIVIDGTTATIIVNPSGDYEYSINSTNYQTSNVFTVVEGGLYTAFVREKNDCGTDYENFIIITIPNYFTPNNDGYNDLWIIKGLKYYPKAEVKIFDRYGRFIKQLNSINYFWDGTFNNEKLSSDDYWYILKISENSPYSKGHFSLKR